MRRIALLLAATMLTLVGGSAASAQTFDPYAGIPNEVGVSCRVVTASTATTQGVVACTGTGLKPGTEYSITLAWKAIAADAAAASFNASAGAVAFVGAQAAPLTTVITGTVDANGRADGSGVIPAGADSSEPASITLVGTAKDGSAALAVGAVNAEADGTDGGAGAPTTPATGADSGTLALIAAGALVLGAGALVATRRRKTEMVA